MPSTRIPLASTSGARLLKKLEEHPHAPRYTHPGVHRLTPAGLQRARDFALELQTPPVWKPGEVPPWLTAFVQDCYRAVPLYRRDGPPPPLNKAEGFFSLPTTDRADLHREPWAFVPDSQPLDGLVVYNTSGTSGHPLDILTHADTLALYLPLLRAALARHNLPLTGGDRVSLVLVCHQRQTYTYATIMPGLDNAGFVKINLHPADWRDPADRAKFLDDCAPEIITGDPLAFAELAHLPLTIYPTALVSTAMTLTPGLKRELEAQFRCPVLDLYSMNESGPIGIADPAQDCYFLLQPRLYVEILDPDGWPCPPGVRGEVTLSGGFNPFLPLLRYRTGDYAALEWRGALPTLTGLVGRPPVTFRAANGRLLNNIDVAIALRPLSIAQYALHQNADGALRLRVQGAPDIPAIQTAILDLFGPAQFLTIEPMTTLTPSGDKLVQFTSDL